MKSETIINFLYVHVKEIFRIYDPTTNVNKKIEILENVSTKSYELLKMGICLYYCENAKKTPENLLFKTANIDWWTDIKDSFEELYYFLSKKDITIEIEEDSIQDIKKYKSKNGEYNSLLLFSGGLDSYIGALDLERKKKTSILSHTITSNNMFGKAKKLYHQSNILHNFPLINTNSQFKTNTLIPEAPQTRTLLFTLNAIPICDYYGINKIIISENGPLMVNPPFSKYSIPTRTTRPEVIDVFNKIFKQYLEFPLTIELPYKGYTKAEMIAAFKDQEEALKQSYSCFAYRGRTKMCGKCYGCFVRRASMAANSIIESENYEIDIFKYKSFPKSTADYDKFLVIEDLIDYCRKLMFKEDVGEAVEDSIKNANLYDEIDFWDILLNFAKDIFLGIRNYYKINKLDFKKYILGQKYKHIENIHLVTELEKRTEELKSLQV